MWSKSIRQGQFNDIASINSIIRAAVLGWDLSDRVKRLALPSLYYDELDFTHLHFLVAESSVVDESQCSVVGVIVWDLSAAPDSVLVHGLFVRPDYQNRSLGRSLLGFLEDHLAKSGVIEIRVKAQKGAVGFFNRQGYSASDRLEQGDYKHDLVKVL